MRVFKVRLFLLCTDSLFSGLESYVQSKEFDELYDECATRVAQTPFRDPHSFVSQYDGYDDNEKPSLSPHDVSEVEARCYYAGLSDLTGPRLIFTTSKDNYFVSDEYGDFIRDAKLRPVYKHPRLSENHLWETIRTQVRCCIDVQKTIVSC